MEVSELFKPRFRVIADYPNGRYKKNEIVSPDKKGWLSWAGNPSDYPAIFKKLEWWEERTNEDLPKYVKIERTGKVMKLIDCSNYWAAIPATEKEFNNQNKKL